MMDAEERQSPNPPAFRPTNVGANDMTDKIAAALAATCDTAWATYIAATRRASIRRAAYLAAAAHDAAASYDAKAAYAAYDAAYAARVAAASDAA